MKGELYSNFGKSDKWPIVDELESRPLDFNYPEKVIKAIKRLFYEEGASFFIETTDEYALELKGLYKTPDRIQPFTEYLTIPTPNVRKALTEFFKYWVYGLGYERKCPPTQKLIENVFSGNDKLFSMILDLRKYCHVIRNLIIDNKMDEASIIVGKLISAYNIEVVDLINEYLQKHTQFVKENVGIEYVYNKYQYYVIASKHILFNMEPYISIIIKKRSLYATKIKNNSLIIWNDPIVYKNGNILSIINTNRFLPTGDFLTDAKIIHDYKLRNKPAEYFNDLIIDFNDLMTYGCYNDNILLTTTIDKFKSICGTDWLVNIFSPLKAYCTGILKIESRDPEVYQDERLANFIRVVNYINENYSTFVRNKNEIASYNYTLLEYNNGKDGSSSNEVE